MTSRVTLLQDTSDTKTQGHPCTEENSRPTRRLFFPNQEDRRFLPSIVSYHISKEEEEEKTLPDVKKFKMTIQKTLTTGIDIGILRLRFGFSFLFFLLLNQ